MERYRVSLDLALPEFDTYGCLKEFAKHPGDKAALAAYLQLRRRASLKLSWDAGVLSRTPEQARNMLLLRVGARMEQDDNFRIMLNSYDDICEKLKVDPHTSVGRNSK